MQRVGCQLPSNSKEEEEEEARESRSEGDSESDRYWRNVCEL